jgi:hypothetical protein
MADSAGKAGGRKPRGPQSGLQDFAKIAEAASYVKPIVKPLVGIAPTNPLIACGPRLPSARDSRRTFAQATSANAVP